MTLLKLNAIGERTVTANGQSLDDMLTRALMDLPEAAPITIMVHGFKFSPSMPEHSPHDHILSLSPTANAPRVVSWPRHLGFDHSNSGLAVAFGWEARGSLWAAHREASIAGFALANLIRRIRRITRTRPSPINIIAHSLGARVVLTALAALPAHSFGRIVLLASAAFEEEAELALASPAGRTVEVLNIRSRQNRLFEGLLSVLLAQSKSKGRPVAGGLRNAPANWLDLDIDNPDERRALRGLGFPIRASQLPFCHWSGYLRPGLFPLYRAFFRGPAHLPLNALDAAIRSAASASAHDPVLPAPLHSPGPAMT